MTLSRLGVVTVVAGAADELGEGVRVGAGGLLEQRRHVHSSGNQDLNF